MKATNARQILGKIPSWALASTVVTPRQEFWARKLLPVVLSTYTLWHIGFTPRTFIVILLVTEALTRCRVVAKQNNGYWYMPRSAIMNLSFETV